ncbi:DUF1878 family protein [Metabacillus litoralis]|uniref:DUF1878 family protein n=1 Tax=Metabacillus litoralis TaxID=152268 RepID=UPI001CFD9B1D|nr:DUF1878 family protein [Metabacillus litoralis]
MDSMEKRLEKLEYYQALLLQMVDTKRFPFYQLVMEKGLCKTEIEEIDKLCYELNSLYEEQKTQGLVIFTDLLTRFAGSLNSRLEVEETIQALYKQNLYPLLMADFLELMKSSY